MPQPYFTNQPSPVARMDMQAATAPGRYMAQGLQQASQSLAAGFAAGIERKHANDRKKQEDEQALQFIKKLAPQMGMADLGDDDLKAGIKGMGGGSEFMKLAGQIQQAAVQKQQAEAMQQEEARRQREEKAARRETLARQYALSQPELTAKDMVGAYGRAGGSDPSFVNSLTRVEGGQPQPTVLDLGGGVKGVWDGNNFSRIPDSKEEFRTGTVGGREMTVGPGNKYFDTETGAPIDMGGEKPLDPTTQNLLVTRFNRVIEEVEGSSPPRFIGKEEYVRAIAGKKQQANLLASQLGYAPPYPEEPTPKPTARPGAVAPAGVRSESESGSGQPARPEGMPEGFKWNPQKRRWER